ncbi:FtsX-like permease family protein [Streptomyces sp. NPDC091027]|uniref:FtsX-like permease family protein n=1 Tax=Streptomyces sp. NPDC091027 TaxID=3365971 RepID=UPI00380932BC
MTTPPPTGPTPPPTGSTAPRTGAPAPAAGQPSGPRPAPWVGTRLRAMPLAAVLAAALAFVTVLLAAALPRAQDRGADQALRDFLQRSGPTSTSLRVGAPVPQTNSAEALDGTLKSLLARTGDTFHVDEDQAVHGTRTTKRRPLLTPGLSRPSGLDPHMSLLYVRQAEAHGKLVEGQWPRSTPPPALGASDGASPDMRPLQVALSKPAADTLGARVGSVLTSNPQVDGTPSVEVVGIYAPDRDALFWSDELGCLARACERYVEDNLAWDVDALVGTGDLDRLVNWDPMAVDFWRLPVDVTRLRADRLDATAAQVASYVGGPTAAALTRETGRDRLHTTSWLPELFEQARIRRQAAAPLAAIGPAGVAGVAFVVLCLAGALAGDRRAAELRLLLARGGSRAGIAGRLLGEGAVTVLPAAAAATALAVLLLPTPRLAPALWAAATVTLLAVLAFPVRAAVLLTPPRRANKWRRIVAELLVVVATAAAVVALRRRGVAPPGSDLDPLLVAAPLLLALCGGLLLARVQPVLTGMLARAAARGSGLVGFLGLARAARGSGEAGPHGRGRTGPSVLPMVAMLLAITTGGFGAAVLESVKAVRSDVARLTVGGDAAITASGRLQLPAGVARAAGELPGVRTSVPLWVDYDTTLRGGARGSLQLTVVVADPAGYAALSRSLGCGSFDPALLAGGGTAAPGTPVPALFSAGLARQVGEGTHTLRTAGGTELQARAAAVLDCTPVAPAADAPTVVLPAGPATTVIGTTEHPNRWLATGSVDAARLRALVRDALPAAARTAAAATPAPAPAATGAAARATDAVEASFPVRTSAEAVAELAADPLQRSAGRLFWASVAAAAGFALLAVLLTLLRSVPDRIGLLARLRTMGLRRRQGVWLILAETLPQTLAAAAGGALVAVAAIALLGPAMDLSTLVGAKVPTGVRLTAAPVLTQALGLAALVAVAVLVEAATSGRRQITTELRAGDQR